MLHLILPPALHRQAYRVAFHVRRHWLRLFVGEIRGCSVIARDGAGRVLLVRHSYGSGLWCFPGGGINRGEEPQAAAHREFAEELGCAISQVQAIGVLEEDYHGTRNVAHVFTGLVAGDPRPDRREIVEARFFARDALPQPIAASVTRRLALLDRA